jgi:hypothetical protein
MGVEALKLAGNKRYKSWTLLLPNVIRNLNRKFVGRTRFRRNVVDDNNFDELLEALHGPDATLMQNTSQLCSGSILSKKWKNRIWKFGLGQKVLVKKRALGEGGLGYKPSVEGGYSNRPYTVSKRCLKSSDKRALIPGKMVTFSPAPLDPHCLWFRRKRDPIFYAFRFSIPSQGSAWALLSDRLDPLSGRGRIAAAAATAAEMPRFSPAKRGRSWPTGVGGPLDEGLALLKTVSVPGSDILDFNFVSPSSEDGPCWARLVDIYVLDEQPSQQLRPPTPVVIRSPTPLVQERPDPLEEQEEEEPEDQDASAISAAPLTLSYQVKVDWKRIFHQATLKTPYKKGTRISDFVGKWNSYHQRNVSAAFPFLKVKPAIMYVPSGIFTVVLPPGCVVYTEDPLLFGLLGFSGKLAKPLRGFSSGGGAPGTVFYGFRNSTQEVQYISGDEGPRSMTDDVEAHLVTHRVSVDLRKHDPKEIKVTLGLLDNMQFVASGASEEANDLEEAASNLAANIVEKANLKTGYLQAEANADDGSVTLKAKQERGNRFLVVLAPSTETARLLGLTEITSSLLHFGLGAGMEGSGLTASDSFQTSLTLALPQRQLSGEEEDDEDDDEQTDQEEDEDFQEAVAGDEVEEEEERLAEPQNARDPGAAPAIDGRADQAASGDALDSIVPFSVLLLGQRGTSFVQDWGFTPLVGYMSRSKRLTSVSVKLQGSQSVLSLKLLKSDYRPYSFPHPLSVYVVLQITSEY